MSVVTPLAFLSFRKGINGLAVRAQTDRHTHTQTGPIIVVKIVLLVYDLKFVGPLEFKLVAPMPEQLKTIAMHVYEVSRKPYVPPDTSEKCIVVVPTCSGMGATKFRFWVLRS